MLSVSTQSSWGCRQIKEDALEVNKVVFVYIIKYSFFAYWINCYDFWNVAMFINKVVTNEFASSSFFLHSGEKFTTWRKNNKPVFLLYLIKTKRYSFFDNHLKYNHINIIMVKMCIETAPPFLSILAEEPSWGADQEKPTTRGSYSSRRDNTSTCKRLEAGDLGLQMNLMTNWSLKLGVTSNSRKVHMWVLKMNRSFKVENTAHDFTHIMYLVFLEHELQLQVYSCSPGCS